MSRAAWADRPGLVASGAVFSDCGRYRYALIRRWDDRPAVAWVMLNPSRADQNTDDATIRKCSEFARRWGHGGIRVVNLFGIISTSPVILRDPGRDVVGPENDSEMGIWTVGSGVIPIPQVVVAWGADGTLRGRHLAVAGMLRRWGIKPVCLGTTKNGQPRHPGRLAYDTPLEPWTERA